jgi:nitroreductase
MTKAIRFDSELNLPVMSENSSKYCIHCLHCIAVCPTGALSINGINAADCPEKGDLPSPETMANLLRQRRSIRRFKKSELPPEELDALLHILHWTPTGCNDHRLRFFVAGPNEIAKFKTITDRWMKFLIKSGLMGIFMPRYRRYFDDILRGADAIYRNAPHLIIVMAPKKAPCCVSDQVIALTQFDMMAQSMNIGTCWCGFAEYAFRLHPGLRKMIGCPRNYRIGAAMLFGRPAVEYHRATEPEKFVIQRDLTLR